MNNNRKRIYLNPLFVEYIDKKKGENCTDSSTFYYIAITIKSITSDCVNETIYFPFFSFIFPLISISELSIECFPLLSPAFI